jgi:alkylation response protein AidB-like acyl-CoA dehydrogenase
MTFLMHAVTTATIAAGGGPRAAALLPALARGELLGTLAFSERGTGAHFHAPELRAEPLGGGRVRITGRKAFVTSAGHAGVQLVLVRGDAGVDCYAVDAGAPGVSVDGVWDGCPRVL